VEVLKAFARANRALAELKGAAQSIPNQGILINTLALQEAKASDQFEIFEYGFRADNSGLVQAKGSAEEADKQVQIVRRQSERTDRFIRGHIKKICHTGSRRKAYQQRFAAGSGERHTGSSLGQT
jgi:hypothetical protein